MVNYNNLVGGWTNPFEKYAQSSNWIFAGIAVKVTNKWNHHLVIGYCVRLSLKYFVQLKDESKY